MKYSESKKSQILLLEESDDPSGTEVSLLLISRDLFHKINDERESYFAFTMYN